MSDRFNLENMLLVATPAMRDPRFAKSVIYICSHTDDGAMGLVLNRAKQAGDGETLHLSELLDQIGVEGTPRVADTPVLAGGPVDMERGFVLHTADYDADIATMELTERLRMTSTKEVLDALVTDAAPTRAILAVGYAGWTRGQLEDELAENAWLVCQAEPDAVDALVFETDLSDKWAEALAEIGIDPAALGSFSGSA